MIVLILMNMEWSMLSHFGCELIVVGILCGMKGHQKKNRTKISGFSITKRPSLVPSVGDSVNKTEMSGAAMAGPGRMMREEAKTGG